MINKLDISILKLIKANKFIIIPELSNKTGKSEPTIHRHLASLISKGILQRVGSRKTVFWKVLPK